MNLRVDLILPTEQRSASVVNPRMLLRVASIVVPVLLLALAIMQIAAYMRLRADLNDKEAEWQAVGPKEQAATQLNAEYQANCAIQKELQGWKTSQMNWHEQMTGLMRETPRNIQIQGLALSQVLQLVDNRAPVRSFSMTLKGKATGTDAEQSVEDLKRRLVESPAFAGAVTNAEVRQFGADVSPNADKLDRVFEILCRYRERTFE